MSSKIRGVENRKALLFGTQKSAFPGKNEKLIKQREKMNSNHVFLLLLILFLFYIDTFSSNRIYNFPCTSIMQNITVPVGYTTMFVDMTGAASGSGGTLGTPGYGARVQSYYSVTPGSVLHINVGCRGTSCGSTLGYVPGGYNGGGAGYGSISYVSTGGGGASDIRVDGVGLQNRILVAGGGGGYYCSGTCGALKGGDGGKFGQAGSVITFQACPKHDLPGAGGGDWTTGGTAGLADDATVPTAGALGRGGNGGSISSGGGGGGYYGGT
jgi:hypothetical protein